MSGGIIVSGVATCPVDGLTVRTFAEGGVHRFPSKGKRARAVELVIHETVTRSVDSTIAGPEEAAAQRPPCNGADGRSRSTEISRPTSQGTRASTTARHLASRS